MTTDPQVLDGTLTIADTGTTHIRIMSATESMEDRPLTSADRRYIAASVLFLLPLLTAIVLGGWLLAPEGWLP